MSKEIEYLYDKTYKYGTMFSHDHKRYQGNQAFQEEDFLDACKNGDLDKVCQYIKSGVDITFDDNAGVKLASEHGHTDIVKCLVQKGANFRANDDEALRWASSNNHIDIVKYLVEHGADISASENECIIWASIQGHKQLVEYFISRGVDVTCENNKPLLYAIRFNRKEIIWMLISRYTHETIDALEGSIPDKLYKKLIEQINIFKEQKRQVTDMIYCSPDLLPKTKTRVMGYNVILGLEMVENIV